jgi:hypothetical protein
MSPKREPLPATDPAAKKAKKPSDRDLALIHEPMRLLRVYLAQTLQQGVRPPQLSEKIDDHIVNFFPHIIAHVSGLSYEEVRREVRKVSGDIRARLDTVDALLMHMDQVDQGELDLDEIDLDE